MTHLRIGMPAGSLADPKRGGNLVDLLTHAGFKTKGYDAGGPTRFTTIEYLFGWDGRPQEFGAQLGLDELDVAIAGDDWVKERLLELKHEYQREVTVERVLSLNRGGVRLVGIAPGDCAAATTADLLRELCARQAVIRVVSEMPYLALDWIRTRLDEIGQLAAFDAFSVQKYPTPAKIERGVVIYETWGKTEAKVRNGGADLGMEITQSGSAIRNYGLKIIDEVLTSETAIYINPAVKNDADKLELLRMFLLNLYGSVNAEHKVVLLFNVANDQAEAVENYLQEHRLFGDEPTVNRGSAYTEYSVQVDTGDPATPIAKVRYELAKRGAVNIDTLPLDSSIGGIGVLPV